MSILHEAHDLINGQRAKDYGSPDINFAHIAAIWSGVLTPIISRNITSVEVALCMQGVKMARLAKSPDHRDSAVDNCGYAGIIEKLVSSHTEAQCNLDVVPCHVDKEQNESSAIEWLQNSAARGGVHAQFYLGSLYEKGQIVVKDKTKAFQLYEKAAKQGHGYAQFKLGYMYHKGKGVEKNESTAVAWFQKAADQGHAEAQLKLKALGSLLANKTVSLYKNASVGQTVFGCAET